MGETFSNYLIRGLQARILYKTRSCDLTPKVTSLTGQVANLVTFLPPLGLRNKSNRPQHDSGFATANPP